MYFGFYDQKGQIDFTLVFKLYNAFRKDVLKFSRKSFVTSEK